MAWIHRKTGEGPFPWDAGEYCGNYLPGKPAMAGWNETQEEAERRQARYLSTMRFGRPRDCKAGTTEEMESEGWVGLYLKESRELMLPWEKRVSTPPELMEPTEKKEL